MQKVGENIIFFCYTLSSSVRNVHPNPPSLTERGRSTVLQVLKVGILVSEDFTSSGDRLTHGQDVDMNLTCKSSKTDQSSCKLTFKSVHTLGTPRPPPPPPPAPRATPSVRNVLNGQKMPRTTELKKIAMFLGVIQRLAEAALGMA